MSDHTCMAVENCGDEPCGQPAHFTVYDGEDMELRWLCARHFDQVVEACKREEQ